MRGPPPGSDARLRPQRWAIVTVMLATTAVALATNMVTIALPDVMRAFRIGQETVQWLATAFMAAMTATMLLTAWFVRTLGQRRTYFACLGLFLGSLIAAVLAPDANGLIVARTLQGAAAGVLQPLAMITLFQAFPPERRGRAMSLYGLGLVFVPTAGPVVGGFLVDHYGWQAVFLLAMPFAVVSLLLVPRCIPRQAQERSPVPFDGLGFVLLCLALATLLAGLTSLTAGPSWGRWRLPLLAGAAAFIAAFLAWEKRARPPLIDAELFRGPAFRAAAWVGFAYGFGFFGSFYIVLLFVQTVARYGAGEAGLMLVPSGIVLAAVIPVAGRLVDRSPARRVVIAGLAFFGLSCVLFALTVDTPDFVLLAAAMGIGRIGLGLLMPALNAGAMRVAPARFATQVPGAISFSRQLGGAMGVNLLAVLLEGRTAALCAGIPCAAAFRDAFLALALVFLAAFWPAWRMRRDPARTS